MFALRGAQRSNLRALQAPAAKDQADIDLLLRFNRFLLHTAVLNAATLRYAVFAPGSAAAPVDAPVIADESIAHAANVLQSVAGAPWVNELAQQLVPGGGRVTEAKLKHFVTLSRALEALEEPYALVGFAHMIANSFVAADFFYVTKGGALPPVSRHRAFAYAAGAALNVPLLVTFALKRVAVAPATDKFVAADLYATAFRGAFMRAHIVPATLSEEDEARGVTDKDDERVPLFLDALFASFVAAQSGALARQRAQELVRTSVAEVYAKHGAPSVAANAWLIRAGVFGAASTHYLPALRTNVDAANNFTDATADAARRLITFPALFRSIADNASDIAELDDALAAASMAGVTLQPGGEQDEVVAKRRALTDAFEADVERRMYSMNHVATAGPDAYDSEAQRYLADERPDVRAVRAFIIEYEVAARRKTFAAVAPYLRSVNDARVIARVLRRAEPGQRVDEALTALLLQQADVDMVVELLARDALTLSSALITSTVLQSRKAPLIAAVLARANQSGVTRDMLVEGLAQITGIGADGVRAIFDAYASLPSRKRLEPAAPVEPAAPAQIDEDEEEEERPATRPARASLATLMEQHLCASAAAIRVER